jgi:hypothetical protein
MHGMDNFKGRNTVIPVAQQVLLKYVNCEENYQFCFLSIKNTEKQHTFATPKSKMIK